MINRFALSFFMHRVRLERNVRGYETLHTTYRSQFLFDRLGWCIKLFISTDSTSSHEFASQFGLTMCFIRETHTKAIAKTESRASVLNAPITVDRSPATTWAATTAIIAATDWAKTAKTRVYTFTTWLCVCKECVQKSTMTNCFLMLSSLKINLIFYFWIYAYTWCVARVTCLVYIINQGVGLTF